MEHDPESTNPAETEPLGGRPRGFSIWLIMVWTGFAGLMFAVFRTEVLDVWNPEQTAVRSPVATSIYYGLNAINLATCFTALAYFISARRSRDIPPAVQPGMWIILISIGGFLIWMPLRILLLTTDQFPFKLYALMLLVHTIVEGCVWIVAISTTLARERKPWKVYAVLEATWNFLLAALLTIGTLFLFLDANFSMAAFAFELSYNLYANATRVILVLWACWYDWQTHTPRNVYHYCGVGMTLLAFVGLTVSQLSF